MAVEVARDLFGSPVGPERGWETSPAFQVQVDPADTASAAQAMRSAAARFALIDERGRELDYWEVGPSGTYTPNFVSKVCTTPRGLLVWLDTKGELSHAMGTAMIRVLVEELDARGLSARVVRPDSPVGEATEYEFDDETPRDQCSQSEPGTPRFWYIIRSFRAQTTDGRSFDDCEYWSPDNGWSFDRRLAATYQEPPNDRVTALRAEERPKGVGEPTWVFMTAEQDPWVMPPPELRPLRGG